MKRLKRFIYTRIYRTTRRWRHGEEPVDPKSLIKDPDGGFWATPTFRYFRVWPWDRQRPRWLPAYSLPDFTPSSGNILPYPERRALNRFGPEEAYNRGRGDRVWVRCSTHGANVWDARFSAHGRQHSSDVWCQIEIPWEWLRGDLLHDRNIISVCRGGEKYFLAWVPAIWLAPIDF